MNSRERFEFYVKNGLRKPDDDLVIIRQLVNRLIDNLYIPEEGDAQFIVDKLKTQFHGMDGEPINWGDLKCFDVQRGEENYSVLIDEASPDACPMLCEYIEKFMKSWGWSCVCETEW